MIFIDILLGTLLAYSFYKGFSNGFFLELASLISFIIGVYIAIKFSDNIGNWFITNYAFSEKIAKITAFIVTLLVVIVAIHLLAKIFTRLFSFAFLGWLNTILGGLFAVIKTALLLGIVLGLFQKINSNYFFMSKETQEKSIFISPCLKTSTILLPVLSNWFDSIKEKVKSS